MGGRKIAWGGKTPPCARTEGGSSRTDEEMTERNMPGGGEKKIGSNRKFLIKKKKQKKKTEFANLDEKKMIPKGGKDTSISERTEVRTTGKKGQKKRETASPGIR